MNNLDDLAKKQLEDYRQVNPGTCFAEENFELSIDEAYAIQDAVVGLRLKEGEKVIGYKVGCTGPGTTKLFGMKGPIRGTLFDSEVHQSGVILNANNFLNLAIEAEMALEKQNCVIQLLDRQILFCHFRQFQSPSLLQLPNLKNY